MKHLSHFFKIIHISHVLYPLKGRQPFIYTCVSSSYFNSYFEVPLPIFGFLACGVYPFHLYISIKLVSVALLKTSFLVSLRTLSAVSFTLPRFIFSSSTNTIVIADYASMDFPLLYKKQRLPCTIF